MCFIGQPALSQYSNNYAQTYMIGRVAARDEIRAQQNAQAYAIRHAQRTAPVLYKRQFVDQSGRRGYFIADRQTNAITEVKIRGIASDSPAPHAGDLIVDQPAQSSKSADSPTLGLIRDVENLKIPLSSLSAAKYGAFLKPKQKLADLTDFVLTH
jgi:hypothetical protein